MESKIFNSFGEASTFAKSLGQRKIKHKLKHHGSSWLVEHDAPGTGSAETPPDSTDYITSLRQKIDSKELDINLLKKQISKEREDFLLQIQELKIANTALQNNIETEVSSRTEEEERRLSKAKTVLSKELEVAKAVWSKELEVAKAVTKQNKEELEVAKAVTKQNKEELHKLVLLEKEYAKKFGKAEVKVVKEKVSSSMETCPRCGGDGGVKGGCRKCDGRGWIDVTEEISREIVVIK